MYFSAILTASLTTSYLSMMSQVGMANALSIGRRTTTTAAAATEFKDHGYADTKVQQLYKREDPGCCVCSPDGSGGQVCTGSCCPW